MYLTVRLFSSVMSSLSKLWAMISSRSSSKSYVTPCIPASNWNDSVWLLRKKVPILIASYSPNFAAIACWKSCR